jgi:hypothetical protein
MKIFEVETSITESTGGFDSIGMPKELSTRIVKRLDNIKHDAMPVPITKMPTSKALKNRIVIRQSSEGWHVIWQNGGQYGMFRAMEYAGRFVEEAQGEYFKNVKHLFGSGKSKMWEIKSPGWSENMLRSDKPASDVNSVADRTGSNDMTGGDIIGYVNRVFLPTIKEKIIAKSTEMFISLRDIPKEPDSPWDSPRAQGLRYAEAMDELARTGFSVEVQDKFLENASRIHNGLGSFPRNRREFAALIKEPNGRAKFAKTLLDMADYYVKAFNKLKGK